MVEQMVTSNLSKYGLGKTPLISDKQPVPVKNTTTVRDLQNDNKQGPPIPVPCLNQTEKAGPPTNNNNVNRNLVYARRKSDAELNRTSQRIADKNRTPQMEPKIEPNDALQQSIVSYPAMEHWNARFIQLQKYLTQCDASNQDVYLQKLRSFSPDECSRHAVELERRAIQLMLEEGREIQRVKDLNILGKSAGNHPLLRPPSPIFKSEKFV